MTTAMTRTELQAWIDAYATPDAPDAQALADFLGIELAEPEPEIPVGQRRRSPGGIDVIFGGETWLVYAARHDGGLVGKSTPTYSVADWEIVTDAPEVPENIIAAVTCLIAETGESLQGSRGIARRMADAGLLVGTTSEAPKCDLEHLPSHSVRICLATISDDFLADLARGAGSPIGPVADAAYRERDRRRRRRGGGDGMTDYNDIEETA